MTFDKQSVRRAIWWLFIALFLAAGYVIRDGYFDPILASTAVIVDKMEEQRDNNDELMNYENLTARASHVSYRQYQVGESIDLQKALPLQNLFERYRNTNNETSGIAEIELVMLAYNTFYIGYGKGALTDGACFFTISLSFQTGEMLMSAIVLNEAGIA